MALRSAWLMVGVAAYVHVAGLPAGAGVEFTKAPEVVERGGAVVISFAVSEPTDVMVAVEDGEGKVIRHLVAGVLGKNPPEPLAAGALEQSVVWDRKDDLGKPVAAGAYRVRVAAGLRARYAGTAFAERSGPNNLTNVTGLVCGPDGRLYVHSIRWRRIWWTATSIHVFRRDGSYEKTIKPFPPTLSPKRLEGIYAIEGADGRPLPIIHRVLAMTFYPYEDIPQQLAITPDGRLHYVVVPAVYNKPPDKRLASIDVDGGIPYEKYAGEKLMRRSGEGHVCLTAASDGKAVYVTGIGNVKSGRDAGAVNPPVVYRIPLPDRAPATPFFGDPAVTGGGERTLNDPRGLATDGRGHLLITDRRNNRIVVVRERDASPVAAMAVPSPTWVAVHRTTGAVYVRSSNDIVKFSGWKDGAEQARMALPPVAAREQSRVRWSFALDDGADPAVVWIGRDRGGEPLMRCVDTGAEFTAPTPAGYFPSRTYWNLSAGQQRREVSCKVGGRTLRILDEATGSWRDLNLTGSPGQTYRLGPNGQIYGQDHSGWGIRRWYRDGRPMPYSATADDKELRGRLPSRPSGTTAWERDFCIDRQGNVYVKHRGKHYHGRMRVDVYDSDGNFKRTVLWVVSDGALGPRVDLKGNLYVAESIRPLDRSYPETFDGAMHGARMRDQYTWMYGSVIKFGPPGGAVWFPILTEFDTYGFDGKAGLPPGLKKETVGAVKDGRKVRKPAILEGALWWKYGCSFVLDMHRSHNKRCHCTATEIDIDDFGRVYYPDQGRFRVTVLDTNGNEIAQIGGYGNQDYVGPAGYVVDPAGKFLRPRRSSDPANLKSPFAEPEIAIGWIVGLAATEKYLYLADALNRRVLRAGLGYECDARVDVP